MIASLEKLLPHPAPGRSHPKALLGAGKTLFPLRLAFTLIELLVVIVIIGILAAATTGVAVKVIASQRRAATQLLVDTLNNALTTQASKLVDQTRKSVDATTAGDADIEVLNQVLNQWNLVFVDNINNAPLPSPGINNQAINHPAYKATMLNHGLNGASNTASFNGLALPNGSVVNGGGKNDPTNLVFEKAFCLYMVLKVGRFSSLDPETLGGNTIQFGSDGSRKIPFLADQWGDPIYLFPGNPFLQGSPATPSNPPKALSSNL